MRTRILLVVCIVLTTAVAILAVAVALNPQYHGLARAVAGSFAGLLFYVTARVSYLAGVYRMPVATAVMVTFISWDDFWHYAGQVGTTLGREWMERLDRYPRK